MGLRSSFRFCLLLLVIGACILAQSMAIEEMKKGRYLVRFAGLEKGQQ